MDGTGDYYAKLNKTGNERQIPYDLSFKWNLTTQTSDQNRIRGIETWNRLTAGRGEWGRWGWLK